MLTQKKRVVLAQTQGVSAHSVHGLSAVQSGVDKGPVVFNMLAVK